MHNPLTVRVVQRGQQIAHDAHNLIERIADAAVQVVLEIMALDELHHQVGNGAIPVGIVDADDVGMLQTGDRAGLGAKTHFVVGHSARVLAFDAYGLDSNPPVQVGIARFVHHPHGAMSDRTNQFVPTEFLVAHGLSCGR